MKRSFKKILTIALAIALIGTMAACGGGNTTNTNTSTETIVGGWSLNTGDMDINANPEALEAFQKAIEELLGCDYEPVALLATQVVSGTNYCILARTSTVTAQPYTTYQLVYVYQDLEGNCEALQFQDLLEGMIPADGEILDGGWGVNAGSLDIADAGEAFEKATSGMDGAEFEPVCLLASQVVAGMNYHVLARKTLSDGTISFVTMTIYEDLSGECGITEDMPIDIALE